MYQLVGAAVGIAAAAFVWSFDPILGLLLGICVLVWVAITAVRAPRRLSRPAKRVSVLRFE